MLKRVHVKGYKSLTDVEVELEPLVVLFGPNASGKSNFLDALRLLSMVGTSRTLRDAFDPPYRGTPLESFHMGRDGIEGLSAQERLAFSIEADLRLSESTLTAVDREVRDMRGSARRPGSRNADRQREAVHAHRRQSAFSRRAIASTNGRTDARSRWKSRPRTGSLAGRSARLQPMERSGGGGNAPTFENGPPG